MAKTVVKRVGAVMAATVRTVREMRGEVVKAKVMVEAARTPTATMVEEARAAETMVVETVRVAREESVEATSTAMAMASTMVEMKERMAEACRTQVEMMNVMKGEEVELVVRVRAEAEAELAATAREGRAEVTYAAMTEIVKEMKGEETTTRARAEVEMLEMRVTATMAREVEGEEMEKM